MRLGVVAIIVAAVVVSVVFKARPAIGVSAAAV